MNNTEKGEFCLSLKRADSEAEVVSLPRLDFGITNACGVYMVIGKIILVPSETSKIGQTRRLLKS